ncbi:MFS general substrate transporter [Cucurbitaria berberidis CBS 394.84]|uniref:MFS general substrate transporter n=1 Tax=Cucurbitaria berberidis CBS 394.84 TaxID=1168544 RepID=A0A9P4GHV0_9PLEO|nr:MFS general substrate transporter [Cucurbitaria berberidis CBS 394.84]KAF1845865.1 MFS general substrate transporter [Cucurbitaria berberidis CBS 394.84]
MAESKKSVRFWGIFVALCILAFISALDVSIVMVALPRITAEIGGAGKYVWIANSFVVASSVPQPLFGQLANVFGRQLPFIGSTVLFALGSGIAGGAHNVEMLIAGRTIQGVGAGGIYVLLDIVCCDLVPLRERGKYLGLMFSWSGVAAGMGPVVGGALAEANWRWIFYMNIPICGVALLAILIFMRMKKQKEPQGIDVLGNLIFIPSVLAVLFGLVTGGIEYPWNSWRIILPLVVGVVGWIVFHVQQHFAHYPSVPERLFSNRTSTTAFALTFLSSVMVQSSGYFLPVFFQAVLGTTVVQSGVNFLPFALGTLVFAVVAGVLMEKTGAYKPLHAASFAIAAVGFGLFTLLDDSTAKWATFQLIVSGGLGLTLSTLLPAILASLPESDVASSTATYSFVRTFGYVWGVTIASTIFNGVFDHNLPHISSLELRQQLRHGQAYGFASRARLVRAATPPNLWAEVIDVYQRSLRTIWFICMGISIACFCLVWVEKSIPLRKELDTQYGIDEKKQHSSHDGADATELTETKEKS